jgi:protein phosphatase 1G
VVSKFCAKHLHKEVVRSEAYANGDLGASLENAFLR